MNLQTPDTTEDEFDDQIVNALGGQPSASPDVSSRPSPMQLRQWRWASTRLLVLLWCVYLFGVWLISLQIDSPLLASHWMVWCMLFWLTIVWPAMQLSKTHFITRTGNREDMQAIPIPTRTWVVFVQWFSQAMVAQTILWPLQITAMWVTLQTMWLNAALLAWSLLVGLFVAMGKRSCKSLHRSLAMIICVGLIFGEPVLQAITHKSWPMFISPIHIIGQLLDGHVTAALTTQIMAVTLAACVGWGMLGIIQALPSKS